MQYESFVTYLCLLPYEIFCRLADSVNLDLCAGLSVTALMFYSCLDVLHW